jgi:2-amino-4-hydroxy-6-hydroxymethyldihydropteridine diphosphokinase
MTRAFVGLGSNVGDSPGIVREALERMRALGTDFVNSDLYLSAPWGGVDQPAFIDVVAAFDTELAAVDLLAVNLEIERDFGRVRRERWGPRVLDIDLLLYGEQTIDAPMCHVPHPRMRERRFVLEPLAEIAPDFKVPPDGATARELLAALPDSKYDWAIRLHDTATLAPARRVDYDAPEGPASHYESLRPFSIFDREVFAAVKGALSPLHGKRVLDVGCGTGRFTRQLARDGAAVTGIDSSERMLAAARDHEPDAAIHYMDGDANESLPHGPFDGITAFYSIQYLDVRRFLANAASRLSDGGVLAVATFPHRHFAETEYGRFFPSLPAIDMARFPSVPALERALRDAGFDDITLREGVLSISDDPRSLIERVERRYLSSFFLLPEAEFRSGLQHLRDAWLPQKDVRRTARFVVVSGRANGASDRPGGTLRRTTTA